MSAVADIFRQAANVCRQSIRRAGNVLNLEACELIICGDIHGHRANLAKILDFANLPHNPQRVLVLQEIIHGPLDAKTGSDRSVELLMRVARLMVSHPQNLLLVLGNHDVAQVTGNEIMKDCAGVCKSFQLGVEQAFGSEAAEVQAAINELLVAIPIAICWQGRVLISHSLPSPQRMEQAGTGILRADGYLDVDLKRGGGAYEWTWGRNQTPQQIEALASELGVEFFVLGHRHSGAGFEMVPDRAMSIASDNDRGCVLHLPAQARLTMDNVQDYLKPIITLTR